MDETTTVEALVRGRFVPIPDARARRIRANAWSVWVPRTPEAARALRVKAIDLGSLDDLVVSIDEVEAYQAVVSGETDSHVELTVLL